LYLDGVFDSFKMLVIEIEDSGVLFGNVELGEVIGHCDIIFDMDYMTTKCGNSWKYF